jgi:xanthine dehydrogenase iron-sulfur cluster and FAD-binding subunit A
MPGLRSNKVVPTIPISLQDSGAMVVAAVGVTVVAAVTEVGAMVAAVLQMAAPVFFLTVLLEEVSPIGEPR